MDDHARSSRCTADPLGDGRDGCRGSRAERGASKPGGPLAVALAVAASLAMSARSAHAEDDLPAGRFGVATAFRQNVGELGQDYGLGFLFGIEAGYQPGAADAWSVGVDWSVLFRGWYFADDESLVDQTVGVTEMNFGLRVTRALGSSAPRFIVASVGGTFLRASDPIPPDDEQIYLGPYAGLGIEEYVLRSGFIGLGARYGMLAGGPTSLSLILSFTGGAD